MGLFCRLTLLAVLTLGLGANARAAAAPQTSNHWLRSLLGQHIVTSGDVMLAVQLFVETPGWKVDPSWALDKTAARGWIRRHQIVQVASPATRGFAAQLFAQALHIKGGVWLRLTGNSAYHAYRELKLLGMLPEGGPGVLLTGDELSGLMSSAARYQEVGPERPATSAGR